MNLVVRAATVDDAETVVPLIYVSSEQMLAYNFGVRGPALSFLRADFVRGRGIFGAPQQLLGIEPPSRIVATCTAYRGGRVRELAMQTARTAFSHFSFFAACTVVFRSIRVAPLFIPPKPDSLFLANGAVLPGERSRGLFTAMLEQVLANAPDDLKRAECDVSFANERARKLYERIGFRVVAERPYRGQLPLDGFRRMEIALR